MKRSRKTAARRGSMLVELSLAIVLLLFISLWAFRTNLQTIRPRNWAMVQTITDAYMTGPLAEAESVAFEDIIDAGVTRWPTFPDSTSTPDVVIGSLGLDLDGDGDTDVDNNGDLVQRTITGTLVRTKRALDTNLPAAGGTGTILTNPARAESWLLESHLTYQIGGRTYVKTRTTVRTR